MLDAFEDFRRRLKFASGSKNPQELVESFQNSDLVNCKKPLQNRIVFNIGNNKYRLICGYLIAKNECRLFVKFAGTHKQYDKIDACTIDMFK